MTAQEILQATFENYETLATYADRGQIHSRGFRYKSDEMTDESKLEFSTFFERPEHVFFEFQELPLDGSEAIDARMALWHDGNTVRTWWEAMSQVDEHDDLDLAIAGFTGISSGVACIIPNLLRGYVDMSTLGGLAELELGETEIVNGMPCYAISAKVPDNTSFRLYIDTEYFLLRRLVRVQELSDEESRALMREIYDEMKSLEPAEEGDELKLVMDAIGGDESNIHGSREESTIDWFPRVNLEIPPGYFDFEPPI